MSGSHRGSGGGGDQGMKAITCQAGWLGDVLIKNMDSRRTWVV